ncbi:hypothetical protein SCA6_004993 [Theobroma cacao]
MQRALPKLFSPSGVCALKNSSWPTYIKTSDAPINAYWGTCQKMLKELEPSQCVQSLLAYFSL